MPYEENGKDAPNFAPKTPSQCRFFVSKASYVLQADNLIVFCDDYCGAGSG